MTDHFIALDWAQENMAIARMTKFSDEIKVIDVPSDLAELKVYLKNLRGKKVLTFEETTTAHWLYVELKPFVDKVIVCDPYRNRLLIEGPKTDPIDATKLVQLLKANLVKPVFHNNDHLIKLRKLVSGYDDVVKRGVRCKNQRSAIFRAWGKKVGEEVDCESSNFVLQGLDQAIQEYEKEKLKYEKEFERQIKASALLRFIKKIPGIGTIGTVKAATIVVDGKRFPHRNKFLAYSGLVRLERMSGGRSYGSKKPRYHRGLKAVFKTAALSAIQNDNCFRDYYVSLMNIKRYPEYKARHAVARRIATATLGVLRNKEKFDPKKIGGKGALSK